jgi:hypothetical protein
MESSDVPTRREEASMEKPHTKNDKLSERRPAAGKSIRSGASLNALEGGSFSRMVPAEHLDEARKALADGYKLDSSPAKTVWGRVSDATRHLNAIEPDSSDYMAAQGLMHKANVRERHMKHVCADVANQIMVKQREMLASELEQYYVNRGILVDVELSGPDKTFLRLWCSLFREASIERIADETTFFAHLKNAGFRRVVLGDNDENVWTYRFGKE